MGAGGAGTILIVDDAATVRTLVEMKLRPALANFRFRQAGNGLQALEEIVSAPPAAVLLDVHMPVMDGTTVLCLVKHAAELAPAGLGEALAGKAIAGVDRKTLRVRDPFHPQRGCYEDSDLDGAVTYLLGLLEARYGADLDIPSDGMPLGSIPHYLVGEILARPPLWVMPLILLTTLSEASQLERMDRLGPPDARLLKPFDATFAGRLIAELVARVEGCAPPGTPGSDPPPAARS